MLAWLAVLASASAGAADTDWWYVIMSGDPGDHNAHYADRASIRRAGDRVTIVEAREAETVDSLGIRSARIEVEYDCRARAGRIVRGTFFGPDGSIVAREEGDDQLIPASPDSVAGALLRFACGEEDGLEQLGELGVRDQALLLFRDRAEYLRNNPDAD